MNQQDLTRYRSRLEQLERVLARNLQSQREEYERLSTAERVEPVDEAQVRMQSHTHGAMQFHDEERLTRVRAAIQRIEDGRYGVCAACGGAIAPERLDAKPEAAFCIECERRHEKERGS